MRGKHASKPIDSVIREAHELVDSGARELIVVAQDSTYYGRDIYGESRLTELLIGIAAGRRDRLDPTDVLLSNVHR